MKKTVHIFLAAALLAGLGQTAQADDSWGSFKPKAGGDILLRARGLMVKPDSGGDVTTRAGAGTGLTVNDVSTDYVPEVDLSYFFTENFAVEVIAATTRHRVKASDKTDLGKVSLLPPTVTLQYHPLPKERFSPYIGAGVNYTFFYNEKDGPTAAVKNISYTDGFGFAGQIGLDVALTGNWSMNFDVKKVFLSSDVTTTSLKSDVRLDPWLVGVGVGYRF